MSIIVDAIDYLLTKDIQEEKTFDFFLSKTTRLKIQRLKYPLNC